MFNIDGIDYTLRFNTQKIKTVELVTKKSVTAEVVNNNGILSLQMLETLFSFAVVEEKDLKAVPQSKGIDLFNTYIEENGSMTANTILIEKLQEDVGFLFR